MKKILFSISIVSMIASIAYALPSKEQFFGDIGLGVGNYSYKEPGVMSIKGVPISVLGSIGARHGKAVALIHRIQGAYHKGVDLRYDGALSNKEGTVKTPYSTTSQDMFYQASYTIGTAFNDIKTYYDMMYIGYGYRYLDNKLDGTGSYRREQSYRYIPLGYEANIALSQEAHIQFGVEYRLMIGGKNKSYISQVSGYLNDASFTQDNGSGYRLFFGVKYQVSKMHVFTNIVLEGWSVGDSTSAGVRHIDGNTYTFIEPQNSTTHLYLNVGVGF